MERGRRKRGLKTNFTVTTITVTNSSSLKVEDFLTKRCTLKQPLKILSAVKKKPLNTCIVYITYDKNRMTM